MEQTAYPTFRLQNARLLLTYSEQCDKQLLMDKLNSLQPLKEILIAWETGATGHKHTHCLVEFSRQVRTRKSTIFDCLGLHPNIRAIRTNLHWQRAQRYLRKDDTDPLHWTSRLGANGDHRGPGSDSGNSQSDVRSQYGSACTPSVVGDEETHWLDRIIEAPTLVDALRGQSLRDASATIAVFERLQKVVVPVPIDDEPSPWQTELIRIAAEHHNPRLITWVWDPVGGHGKSWLARHLVQKWPEDWTILKNLGNQRDSATVMKNVIDSGFRGAHAWVDLPRGACIKDFYPALEDISDGCVTTLKYQGKTVLFNPMCIYVGANFLPELGKMSEDRWRIYALDAGKLRALTLSEARAFLTA